jgi:hypothetical protein
MNIWGHLASSDKFISSNGLSRGSLQLQLRSGLVYEPTDLREGFKGYFGKY